MDYEFLTKEEKSKGVEQNSRIEIINDYISDASFIINLTEKALNHATMDNVMYVSDKYTKWVYCVWVFLKNFDDPSAEILFSSSDGVHTSLNIFEERREKFSPTFVFKGNDIDGYFVDKQGERHLQNIIDSLKEKISILRNVKLKITGGILSEKDTEKVLIIFYKLGKIKTSLDGQEIKRKRSSVIFKIIQKLKVRDSIKLTTLAKELNSEQSNISRDIKKLNSDILGKWKPLKDKVIDTTGGGYFMNKQAYNFYYEDIDK